MFHWKQPPLYCVKMLHALTHIKRCELWDVQEKIQGWLVVFLVIAWLQCLIFFLVVAGYAGFYPIFGHVKGAQGDMLNPPHPHDSLSGRVAEPGSIVLSTPFLT